MNFINFSDRMAVFDLWYHVRRRLLTDLHAIFGDSGPLFQKTYGNGQWLCHHRKLHFYPCHATHSWGTFVLLWGKVFVIDGPHCQFWGFSFIFLVWICNILLWWENLWNCNVYLFVNFFVKSQHSFLEFRYLTSF